MSVEEERSSFVVKDIKIAPSQRTEMLNGNSYATNVLGVGGYISRRQNGTTGYLFKNAHGDVLSAYSSTTNKLADYTYDAWGEMQSANETSSFINNPLRYCGEYYDYESGMIYLRARYYDSGIKRFITEDPIKDGVNWYAYANNNPVLYVDPSGLDSYILYVYGTSASDSTKSTYDEALVWKQKKESQYGTDAHVLEITSAEEFVSTWERISNRDNVNAVVIVAHGMVSSDGVGYMGMGNGDIYAKSSKDMYYGDYTADDLSYVTGEELIFSTCNSANPDIYNLVYGFKINNNINYITGWDGGTVFNYTIRDNVKGAGKNYLWQSWDLEREHQGTWWYWVGKDANGNPVRNRIGKRVISGR